MDSIYIGISGITSRAQIDRIVVGHPYEAPPLAMGVLGSYKTLILRQPNRYPNRYPKAEDIPGIWSDDHRVRNVLHYSFAEDDMVPQRSGPRLADELEEIRDQSWPADLWLQVNARPLIRPWIADALSRVRPEWGHIIVQVSAAAIEAWSSTIGMCDEMGDVLRMLAPNGLGTTLLFDASGGTGVPVDVERVKPVIRLAHKFGWPCGVAGGLAPDNLHRLAPLFDICPLSVDVESGVRDDYDNLSIAKARAFRDAALQLHYALRTP